MKLEARVIVVDAREMAVWVEERASRRLVKSSTTFSPSAGYSSCCCSSSSATASSYSSLRSRMQNLQIRNVAAAMKTRPPITPPAIAPALAPPLLSEPVACDCELTDDVCDIHVVDAHWVHDWATCEQISSDLHDGHDGDVSGHCTHRLKREWRLSELVSVQSSTSKQSAISQRQAGGPSSPFVDWSMSRAGRCLHAQSAADMKRPRMQCR